MPIQPYQIAPAPIEQETQVSTPSLETSQGVFYTKTVNGVVEAFYANGGGQDIQLTSNGALVGAPQAHEKSMINGTLSTIPMGVPVSVRSTDNAIVPGDSDDANGQQIIGISLESIAPSIAGKIALFGRNIPAILTGMGFLPGDEVWLGETGGNFIKDPGTLTGGDDSLIRVGVAVGPDGITAVLATDLILIREVVANP